MATKIYVVKVTTPESHEYMFELLSASKDEEGVAVQGLESRRPKKWVGSDTDEPETNGTVEAPE